jgi:hypothetical protein
MRDVLHALEQRKGAHLTQGAVPMAEVVELQKRLGCALPPLLVSLLTEAGNGIFFGVHEVFGPRRLMVHDIELLPDMLSVKAGCSGMPAAWLPFHRCSGVVHAVDLGPAQFGAVFSWPAGPSWPDVASFVRAELSPLPS